MPECNRDSFRCPFRDCIMRGDLPMTEFEIRCSEIAHPNEAPEVLRQRRNRKSLDRYYQKKNQKQKE